MAVDTVNSHSLKLESPLGHNIDLMCRPLDTKCVTAFFSRYPAAISIRAKEVESALHANYLVASEEGTRERRRAEIRHSNPFGDPFAICHCSADPDKLILLATLIDIMWIHDDVTEELSHEQANKCHEALSECLRLDVNPEDHETADVRQKTLAVVLRKAIDIDPGQGDLLVKTLREYLATFDCRDDDFETMAQYMPYRIANCGYWMSSFFIRWGMGMSLRVAEYESIREYDTAMGNILGLTNDYFSWKVEQDQPTDRIRNGVRVLTREHNIAAESAQKLLLGMIVEEEARAAYLKAERLKASVSPGISQYFHAIELYVGGSCYWHATAPRYQTF
ncbi:isoprenoid synthase domain-containing protein, partial [Xylariaceae sp. FL1019]